MMSFLEKWLGGAKAGRRTGRRAPSVRLGVESLEERQVPSATGLLSATTNAAGQPVVFAIDHNGALWENNPAFVASNRLAALLRQELDALRNFDPFLPLRHPPPPNPVLYDDFLAAWGPLSSSAGGTGPNGLVQVSATRNEGGDPVVFGVTRTGQVWENNPRLPGAGWLEVAVAGVTDRGISGLSATRNSLGQPVVFIITGAGHVFEFNPAFSPALQEITTPAETSAWAATGTMTATQDAFGGPVVYVETSGTNFNRAIEEWRQTTAQQVPGLDAWSLARTGNGIGYRALSATQDSQNRPVLFAVDAQGVVLERVPQTSGWAWVQLTTGGVTTLDATRTASGQETVLALATNQTVQQFTAGAGQWTVLPNAGTAFGGSLAATQKGNGQVVVFATDSFRDLWEHDAALPGNSWARLTDRPFGWGYLFDRPLVGPSL
jgi:hypothetical protein